MRARTRTICIVTGTRAEYGIFKPLLKTIQASPELKLVIIATGMHLLRDYGYTVEEIEKDGFVVSQKIPMYQGREKSPTHYTHALARGINALARVFDEKRPDIVVVLGDRLEPLAATLAASFLKIPVAHIHGGDKTDSTDIDESIRHAITRFAHLHFTPTAKTKERLVKMGEEKWRIHRVGALGLDSIVQSRTISKKTILKKFGLDINKKLAVCLFHSIHLKPEMAGKNMRQILDALKMLSLQTVIIYPNNDAGSDDIISQIKADARTPFFHIYPSIVHEDFIQLLKHADIFLGNSSSGIVESPTLKIPFVNVGSRQQLRERSTNIIDMPPEKKSIVDALKKGLEDKTFLKKVKYCKNPFGDGKTTEKIVKVLVSTPLNPALIEKKITY